VPKKKHIFCNKCKHETNHIILVEHKLDFPHEMREEYGFWEELVYTLLLCAGCDTAALEKRYTHSDMYDDIQERQVYKLEFFPKRNECDVTGKRFKQLPEKLDTIYRETVQAFNSGLDVLCAAGLRTLIEGICDDKQIKGKTLELKIDNLKDILPQNIVQSLHSFRFMGNIAVHELMPPKHIDLLIAIEMSEDLLNFLYELDYKIRQLPSSQRQSSPATGD
jgi:hypothetical protein